MTTSTKTYASKSGARKAAKRAGIADELIEITVEGESFGWKAVDPDPVTTVSAKPKKEPIVRVNQNGVTRPALGGKCAAVWEWMDERPNATAKEALCADDGGVRRLV